MSFCHLNGFLLFWINIFRNCIIELSATMLFISLRTNKSVRKLNKIKNEDVIRMIRCFLQAFAFFRFCFLFDYLAICPTLLLFCSLLLFRFSFCPMILLCPTLLLLSVSCDPFCFLSDTFSFCPLLFVRHYALRPLHFDRFAVCPMFLLIFCIFVGSGGTSKLNEIFEIHTTLFPNLQKVNFYNCIYLNVISVESVTLGLSYIKFSDYAVVIFLAPRQ